MIVLRTDKKKKRYCIGRKPVTDFVVGQTYTGKVVYVKPFGVFFDIGCHSDAFAHVSRLSDDYVENPESNFKEGDDVTNIRIVEIDRRKKRITASLQSEARLEDERASVEARDKRKEKLKAKRANNKDKKPNDDGNGGDGGTAAEVNGGEDNKKWKRDKTSSKPKMDENTNDNKNIGATNQVSNPVLQKDPSMMTPAELKRLRKLERRAARREQGEKEPAE